MSVRRMAGLSLAVGALLAGAACASSTAPSPSSNPTSGSSSSGAGSKGTISLSGQNFTEMQIMAALYQQLLEKAGYTVNVHLVATRDIYVRQLESGNVDVVPEYLGALTDYLNTLKNGANAPTISSNSSASTLAKLKPLASADHISMLDPAKATDQNAFAVTKSYASQNSLTTLSDLGALGKPIVLAAAPDCQGRSDCQGGLSKVYKINISKILPLGFDSPQVKDSLSKGESQLGEVATTDGALASENLVILTDDKGVQPAQNLIPAVNSDFLSAHPDVATVLNKLSAVLTTSDLAAMNVQVDVQRAQAADVAQQYLSSKGLI
ncbi:MAG: ABC transporter substrate-binding protein [Nocardioidaceae bacterium]